ncbi:MAG: hypothetical protein H0T63_06090 [Pyrinomonadaceae bacterium]|nr:hypothetical protein [Pyrinomonadaceae bacterium]MDQ3586551.1 hypothetical protein [Acidobacteriota bacterium]
MITLTPLSLKILNSSLKSELSNVFAFDDVGMQYQFPSSSYPVSVALRLPELQIERAIKLLYLPRSFHEISSHIVGV